MEQTLGGRLLTSDSGWQGDNNFSQGSSTGTVLAKATRHLTHDFDMAAQFLAGKMAANSRKVAQVLARPQKRGFDKMHKL